MCARCMLIWEVELLKEKLEELGDELGCWFDVYTTDDLMVLWRVYKGAEGDKSIEVLCNGSHGCNIKCFEEDVERMPQTLRKALANLSSNLPS